MGGSYFVNKILWSRAGSLTLKSQGIPAKSDESKSFTTVSCMLSLCMLIKVCTLYNTSVFTFREHFAILDTTEVISFSSWCQHRALVALACCYLALSCSAGLASCWIPQAHVMTMTACTMPNSWTRAYLLAWARTALAGTPTLSMCTTVVSASWSPSCRHSAHCSLDLHPPPVIYFGQTVKAPFRRPLLSELTMMMCFLLVDWAGQVSSATPSYATALPAPPQTTPPFPPTAWMLCTVSFGTPPTSLPCRNHPQPPNSMLLLSRRNSKSTAMPWTITFRSCFAKENWLPLTQCQQVVMCSGV